MVVKAWNNFPLDGGYGTHFPQSGTAAYRDAADRMGHGTHTTGLVGATVDNAFGVAGMAWQVRELQRLERGGRAAASPLALPPCSHAGLPAGLSRV